MIKWILYGKELSTHFIYLTMYFLCLSMRIYFSQAAAQLNSPQFRSEHAFYISARVSSSFVFASQNKFAGGLATLNFPWCECACLCAHDAP